MLLLTYRSDELHRRHPLRPLLAELDRLERARRIELAPFDRDELARGARRHPRRGAERAAGRAPARAQRGQPALHRGAARGRARRTRRRPAEPARRVHAADRAAVGRRAAGGARWSPSAARSSEQTIADGDRDRARCPARGAARGGRRAGAGAGDRRALRVPPRAAARGAVRRPAAGRARRAAPRARAGARADSAAAMRTPSVERVSAIATHYAAAGDQPAALRATVAGGAGGRNACTPTARSPTSAERALELWPRVAETARAAARSITSICWAGGARPRHRRRPRARRGAAAARARASSTPTRAGPLRGAAGERSRGPSGTLNRGRESLETAQRALALLPAGTRRARERAALLAWLARTRVLRGRYRDAITDGEEALDGGDRRRRPIAESEVLNTLGMARDRARRRRRGRRQPAARDRDRAASTATSTGLVRRTRTSPTSSASPGAPRDALQDREGGARRRRRGACAQPRLDDADRLRARVRGRRLGMAARGTSGRRRPRWRA